MEASKKHWGIVGGGMLGMYLAHRLSQAGQEVTLMEAAENLGGLTSTWKLGDVTWDKYYHVILLSDTTLRKLLGEIGLENELNWVETKTGFYTDGKLHSMSNSFEFLKFPPLSLIDKFRLGLTIFYASKVKNWRKLEGIHVADWLKKWSGKNTFNKIWLPLLRAKLGENYQHTSAAFIWTTIQRMYAARRTGLKKEMFGYVNGGYSKILKTFESDLRQQGVHIKTGYIANNIQNEDSEFITISNQNNDLSAFDEVIVTTPSPIATKICKGLSAVEQEKHNNIEYLGVICVSVLLKKPISPYYVTNITDKTPFTGIIEMTNIVKPEFFGQKTLIYLPKYIKKSDPFFAWSEQQLKALFWPTLLEMYAHLTEDDLVSFQVSKAPNVFALPTLNYSQNLPPISTSIPGVHILNSAHIVNGTLNVNETLQVVEKALPELLQRSKNHQKNHSYV
jgi:protoporphyrinogen oxidase